MGCIQSTSAVDKQGTTTALPKGVAGKNFQNDVFPVDLDCQDADASEKTVQHKVVVLEQHQAGNQPSSPVMVVWRDVEVPLPADEQLRWDQLVEYNILDTEPEEAYDRLTELCKKLFKVPIAMVTFVDKDRVWLKSVQGLPGLKEVERRSSLCAWTLLSRFPEALVVPDLREDVRFKDFPVVVGWPHVRFYAASPLVNSHNMRLGTLCILDLKPREFSADSTTLLAQLASMVMREVERKRAMNDALCSTALRNTSGNSIQHDRQGLMLCDMATPKWPIYLVNDAWQRATGISQEMAAGGHFWDLFEPPAPAQMQACRLAVEQRRTFELRIPCNVGAAGSIGQCSCSTHGSLLLHAFSNASSLYSSTASVQGNSSNTSRGLSQQQQQLGAMPGLSSSSSKASRHQLQQQPDVVTAPSGLSSNIQGGGSGTAMSSGGMQSHGAMAAPGAYVDATQQSRRRSIGSGMRYVSFQFRSVSSAASSLAPSVSIPPALLNQDTNTNYYWATVEMPCAGSQHGGDEGFSTAASLHNPHSDNSLTLHSAARQRLAGVALDGISDLGPTWASSGSGPHTGPASDVSSALCHQPMKTTFNLMPEDNPFQDISIGSLLGWGSYGRVHRGYWNGSLVAIKVLEQIAGDLNPRSTLEPLLHHRLSHPNIVAMFDVCTQEVDVCEDGRPLQEVWMVLEYCNRGTLSDAIQRGWLLSVRDGVPLPGQVNLLKAITTAREVACALHYLHSQNVLHGDLNGNNILLAGAPVSPERQNQRGFTAKVADFGLSHVLSPENEQVITRTHGTITHMAPEVITEATHSKAADVYSFGVVLFELLSGIRPYHGMHYAQIVSSITSGKILQLLSQQAPHLPPAVLQLMSCCLATRPTDRPTFQEVHEKLQQIEMQLAAVSQSPVPLMAESTDGSNSALNARAGGPAAAAADGCGCQQSIHAQAAAAGVPR